MVADRAARGNGNGVGMGMGVARSGETTTAVPRLTVVGLFDDHLDAEQALVALRKADRSPEQVSVVVRDRAAEGTTERTGAVARALVATALDAVGGWLQGLASLIVPERGTYLVAGPLGAALAGIGRSGGEGGLVASSYTASPDLVAAGLLRTLTEFGFDGDVADYLEHRLAAGAALLAVTSAETEQLQTTRRLFADHNAVYLGLAQTDARLASETTAALASPARSVAGSEVVVADAVAPLRRLCDDRQPVRVASACGADVVDEDGVGAGSVSELLADPSAIDPNGTPMVRYVVVVFGGVLGLGRHHVAIPAHQVDLTVRPVRLSVPRMRLQDAPSFDPTLAFSRREELAVCAYFGCDAYWSGDELAG